MAKKKRLEKYFKNLNEMYETVKKDYDAKEIEKIEKITASVVRRIDLFREIIKNKKVDDFKRAIKFIAEETNENESLVFVVTTTILGAYLGGAYAL